MAKYKHTNMKGVYSRRASVLMPRKGIIVLQLIYSDRASVVVLALKLEKTLDVNTT